MSEAELEAERDFLLASLADLEAEHAAGDVDEVDYAALKDDYTARAAAVLRRIESGRAPAAPARPPRRRALRSVAVVAAVAVLAVGAGLLVARTAGNRLPSETISGGIGESNANRLANARQLQGSDPARALALYDEVLQTSPDNPEALTYRAWLSIRAAAAAGAPPAPVVATALDGLDRARAANPGYADAACFSAIVRFRYTKDPAGARGPYVDCVVADPPDVVSGLVQALGSQIDEAIGYSGLDGGDPAVADLLRSARSAPNAQEAITTYDKVLARQPDNVEALAFRGWLVAGVALQAKAPDLYDKAEALVDRAITLRPDYANAACLKASIRISVRNDPAGAKDAFGRCRSGAVSASLAPLVADLNSALGG